MALNVLVVDDSAVMRAVILKMLRMADVPLGEIHEAADGRAAMGVLDENWIDLVFLDLNMPVMNGEELIREVRAREELSDLPILIVSTEGSQTRIDRLQRQGMRFIHKPFSPEAFYEAIREMTGVTHETSA
jgi:two-component system chemotaxis response regulator CheY